MRIILDTNAYTAFGYGHEGVVEHVARAAEILFSTIVAGELLHGFHDGSRFMKNRSKLDEFLSMPQVRLLPVTLLTADRFGRIMAQLKKRGRPLPTNDVWIAAHAMESCAELVTFDPHFDEIAGLANITL